MITSMELRYAGLAVEVTSTEVLNSAGLKEAKAKIKR
jgi:hypothetical protein